MFPRRKSSLKGQITRQQLDMISSAIFGHYDFDNNGYLDQEEVSKFMKDQLLCNGKTEAEVEEFGQNFRTTVDENGDGKLSKEEIHQVMRKLLQYKTSKR